MLLLTIWPIFALICLGHILARKGFPDRGFWPAAERFNYFLLFPALLLANLSEAPIRDPDILRLGGAVVAVVLTATAVMGLGHLLRPAGPGRFGPALQGVTRFNIYLTLSITAVLAGEAGLARAAVLIAVATPLLNLLSIMALTGADAVRKPRVLVRHVLGNPLILACLAGVVVAFFGGALPFGLGRFLDLLAQASLPLGLLCVGAALQPAAIRRDVASLSLNTAVRLLAMPLLAAAAAWGLGLGPVESLVLVVFGAMPTAPSAYVLTRQLGGDAPFMAGIVTLQTLASALTLPIVLALLIG